MYDFRWQMGLGDEGWLGSLNTNARSLLAWIYSPHRILSKLSTLGDRLCSHARQGSGRYDLIGARSLAWPQILSRNQTEPLVKNGFLRGLGLLHFFHVLPDCAPKSMSIVPGYFDDSKIIHSMMFLC
jgi:hypothetical protein